MTGRKAIGFQIEAVNGGVRPDLPPLIECNKIITSRSEIPTPDVALAHVHLKRIAPHISKLDPDAEIMILLGRDVIRVHKVREQVNGLYQPHKPGKIRVVFDSSAQPHSLSLTWVLLTGPDRNNSLLCVLLRFRKDLIAVTADIQQMFFLVKPKHRDYVRFL